jgi:hypothetical protein
LEYKLGEIRRGEEIGKNAKWAKYVYTQCPVCHKNRWADVHHFKDVIDKTKLLCHFCNGHKQGVITAKKTAFVFGKYSKRKSLY